MLGAGCRVKRVAIIDVKIYALAMYVDADAARAQKGKGLLNGDYDKELAIELARDVDGKTFMEAMDESLGPRIREIATNMATAVVLPKRLGVRHRHCCFKLGHSFMDIILSMSTSGSSLYK